MKKLLISIALLVAVISGFANQSFAQEQKQIEVLPTLASESAAPNRIWVGTFQIVWNEVIENITKKPIKFVGFDSQMAKLLNKKSFKKSDISENSYYTKSGIVSPELKATIEKGIKDKFNETSDILDSFDWAYNPQKIFVYAMLKKDFKFLQAFDKLPDSMFGDNYTPVKYFGINEDSKKNLAKNVSVLFYNSNDDFAVKLYTKSNDEVLLYRTNDDKNFEAYYTELKQKTKDFEGDKKFNRDDKLSVPNLALYQETSFKEIEGHRIKGTNFKIDKTIETVDFKMDNEGVKLKSEAAIMMKCMAMPIERGRNFRFDDKFVLFLIENGHKTPYYAMRVDDVETINKTERK